MGIAHFQSKAVWILYAFFFSSMGAACRVSTCTYFHIHLLLLAGQVEGSEHAIFSSRPHHFVRFINLHWPIQWSVLLPIQIHEGPVADTNCVARWIAATKTFSFDASFWNLVQENIVHHKNSKWLDIQSLINQIWNSYIQSLAFKKIAKEITWNREGMLWDSPTCCAFATHNMN